MRVAIDISPLETGNFLQHRVRGTGFYLKNLNDSLQKYYPQNQYLFFKRGDQLPKDIDVIHIPYFEPFFLTLPFNIGENYVVTLHDLTPLVFKSEFPAGLKGNAKWQIQKKLLKKAGAIITDSENSKKDILGITKIESSKIHVVYLAASEKFVPQNDENKKKIIKKYDLPEKFALYVGDVTWNKNLPKLIESFSGTNFRLAIVGQAFASKDYDRSNPWNRDLAKAQDLASKNKNIKALGFVSDRDLVDLYSAATLFTIPSLYEGFGLPLLEAMRSGCPVVSSDAGSLAEVAGDAAYFVDPKNVDSIRDGIEKVANDKNLQKKLSDLGLIQAKKFSWEKTASETVSVYESLAEK